MHLSPAFQEFALCFVLTACRLRQLIKSALPRRISVASQPRNSTTQSDVEYSPDSSQSMLSNDTDLSDCPTIFFSDRLRKSLAEEHLPGCPHASIVDVPRPLTSSPGSVSVKIIRRRILSNDDSIPDQDCTIRGNSNSGSKRVSRDSSVYAEIELYQCNCPGFFSPLRRSSHQILTRSKTAPAFVDSHTSAPLQTPSCSSPRLSASQAKDGDLCKAVLKRNSSSYSTVTKERPLPNPRESVAGRHSDPGYNVSSPYLSPSRHHSVDASIALSEEPEEGFSRANSHDTFASLDDGLCQSCGSIPQRILDTLRECELDDSGCRTPIYSECGDSLTHAAVLDDDGFEALSRDELWLEDNAIYNDRGFTDLPIAFVAHGTPKLAGTPDSVYMTCIAPPASTDNMDDVDDADDSDDADNPVDSDNADGTDC